MNLYHVILVMIMWLFRRKSTLFFAKNAIFDKTWIQKLVKEIYERFSVISSKQVRLISYAEHFIPFTIQWLDDCSIEYCKYVEKSYYIDEEEKFARDNEYVKFRVVFMRGRMKKMRGFFSTAKMENLKARR